MRSKMTTFEDLQSQWKKQPATETPENGSKQIVEKVALIRKKQNITNIVLMTTAIILVFFFFYVSAYKSQKPMIGLSLMIGALATRVGLEILSIRSLKNLNVAKATEIFKKQMIGYYSKRVKIHFIITPIIIMTYCIGFIMLLPSFKENLSFGFYTYIKVSSIVMLVVLSIFIAKQIKNELEVLKELKQ